MPDIHSVHHPQRNFGFVLLPGFSLLDLAAATECLNNANALLGYEAYRWRTFAPGTQHAAASNGITLLADCATDKPVHADRMFVLAEQHPETAGDAPLLGWLRMLDKGGCKVGAIGSGTYTLARAEAMRSVSRNPLVRQYLSYRRWATHLLWRHCGRGYVDATGHA